MNSSLAAPDERAGDMSYPTLSELTPEQVDAVRVIYEEAFPAWQRDPFEALVLGDADPSRVQIAMVDRGNVLALAILSRLQSVPWWFLEYFAVTHERRDQGLGGLLWEAVIRRLAEPRDPQIVMEVERPSDAPESSAERTTRERRIAFYRRRGALPLDVPSYRVPHLSDDGTDELMLLALLARDGVLPSGDSLERLVRALYVEGYGLPTDDPLLGSAVAALEGRKGEHG